MSEEYLWPLFQKWVGALYKLKEQLLLNRFKFSHKNINAGIVMTFYGAPQALNSLKSSSIWGAGLSFSLRQMKYDGIF